MMHKKLLDYVSDFAHITEGDTDSIKEYFEPVSAGKCGFLIKESKIANHLYFINSGFVRVFHLENGCEITTQIIGPSSLLTSFNIFIKGTAASEAVETITPCEFLRVSKEHHAALYEQSKDWALFCKNVYEKAIAIQEQRIKDILTLSAEKRYLKLISTQPEIIRNVPLQYIASYIGIKPESLSRIRRQVIS